MMHCAKIAVLLVATVQAAPLSDRESSLLQREESLAKREAALGLMEMVGPNAEHEMELLNAANTGSSEEDPEYSWSRSSRDGFPKGSAGESALSNGGCYNPSATESGNWGQYSDDEAATFCMEYCLEKAPSKSNCKAMWVYKASGPFGAYRCCPKSSQHQGDTWNSYTTGKWYTITHTPSPPVIPDTPATFCANGVSSMPTSRGPKPWDKCCDKDCGKCGGPGCSKRPGGKNACCTGMIQDKCTSNSQTRCARG